LERQGKSDWKGRWVKIRGGETCHGLQLELVREQTDADAVKEEHGRLD
jgi:hypothetical protein